MNGRGRWPILSALLSCCSVELRLGFFEGLDQLGRTRVKVELEVLISSKGALKAPDRRFPSRVGDMDSRSQHLGARHLLPDIPNVAGPD